MRRAAALLSAIVIVLCAPHGTALRAAPDPTSASTPEGVWLHPNERIRVEIAPCGARLCGSIVWLENPDDETGTPLEDSENPDRTRRDRPVMGMTVIRGLVRDGPRLWADGTIYNPDDGETYSARVTVVDPDTLHVRAYVLLPLFGETLVWTRVGH